MATRTRDLTSQVDGSTVDFVTPEPYLPGTLEVYYNGQRIRRGEEFVELGGGVFRWLATPKLPTPIVGDSLLVQYEIEAPGETVLFPLVVASGIDPTIP